MSLRQTTAKIQRLVGARPDGVYGPNTAARILAHLRAASAPSTPVAEPDLVSELGDRTVRNLRTLEDEAQELFVPFIRRAQAVAATFGCEYVAISGTRSKRTQDALYAKGRTKPGPRVTNARYGYSNHNFKLALDFGVFRNGRYLDSTNPRLARQVHQAVGDVARQLPSVEWGGDWKRFKDIPHFEIDVGLSTAQKRERLFAGKSMFA